MGDKLKYYTVDSWHSILPRVVPAVIFEGCFKAVLGNEVSRVRLDVC